MKSLVAFKTTEDYLDIEYEVFTPSLTKRDKAVDPISDNINYIETLMKVNKLGIDKLNTDIERLTNHADGLDYTIAISSGIISGLIDSIFIGEFDFESAKADSHRHVNKFIEKYAKLRGYEDNGKGLKGAIEFLEKKFPVAQDNVWKSSGISSTKLHHLEDIAHHPTLLGLAAAIMVQFFRISFFINKDGKWNYEWIKTNPTEMVKIWTPIVISGTLNWIVRMAESKYVEKFDKEIPQPIHKLILLLSKTPAIIEILKVVDNWFGHLVSDMGGSKNTPGGGMGIPGIFLSILKEISSLPGIKNTNLPRIVSDLYSKGKMDMRAELAIVEHLGKQSIPVLLNECIVRSFYFIRHLILEKQLHCQWKNVNWENVLPYNNRTINRMITISSGAFMAFDMADAAVRSSLKSSGNPAMFLTSFVLHVNFVGIGRFVIATYSDGKMGVERWKAIQKRQSLYSSQIHLAHAKICYLQAEVNIAMEQANENVDTLYKMVNENRPNVINDMIDVYEDQIEMKKSIHKLQSNNSDFLEDINDAINDL